jgi:hypothetical protein
MKRAMSLIILSAALLCGCATTPAAAPKAAESDVFIGYVTPHIGPKAGETYKVTTDEVTSPRLRLSRVDEGFRGVASQQPLDLSVEKGEVTGSFGSQPVDLRIDHREGKIWVEGIYGGRVVGLFFAERARDSNEPCGMFQPWISLSTGEPDEPPEPSACDVASVATLARMMAYLGEDDALALIAVMTLTGANVLPASSRPNATRHLGLGAARHRTAAPAPRPGSGHHKA